MLKHYITVLLRQFTKSSANENVETCVPVWFEQLKE